MKAILFIIIISTVILMQYAESQLHDIIDIPKNCNGKDFICTSKNEFLLCFDVKGTGETVTIDKISQSCPIGTICDNADTVECYRPDPELSTTKNTISILPPAPTPPKNSRNCNGKDFICLNKKEFLICFDVYGNGQTETIDDVTQSCPIGVICDNTGNFECSMPDPEAISTDNSLIASISSQSSPVDPPTTPSIQATIAVQPSITPEQIHITLNQSKSTSTSSISVDPINIPTISNAVNSTPQVHQSTTGMDSILPTIETTSISMGNTTESIPILISILTTEASTLSSATDLTFGQTSIPATSPQPNIGDMSDVSSISSTTHSVVSQQNKTSITESPLITSTQTSISDNYIENLSVTGSSPGSTNNIDESIKHSTEGFTAEQINVDVVTMDPATGIGDVPATSSTIFMEILSSENTHSVNELLSTTNISTTEPTYLNTEPNMISTQFKVSSSSIFTTDTIANGMTSILNTSGNLPGVQHLTDENSIFTTSTPPNTTNQTADLSDVQNLSSESSIITTNLPNLPSDQYLASESSILTTSTTTNLLNQNTDVTQSDAQYLPSEITSPGTPTNNLLQHIDANPAHVQHLPTESSIIISRTSVNDTDIPVMENLPSETLFLGTSTDETSSTPMLNQHTISTLTHDPYLPSEITSPGTPTKNLLQHIDANPPHVQHLPSESSIIISSASVNDTDIPVMQNLPSETLFTATSTDETSSTDMLNQHSLSHDPYLPGESSIIAPSTPAIEATSFTNQHTDTTNILISENSIITTSTPDSEAKSLINHHTDRDLTIMQNSPSGTPISVPSSHYSPSTSLLNQSTDVNPVDGQYAPSESLILITSRPDSESTSFINQHTDTDISVMQNLITESTILTTSSPVILEPLSLNQQIGTASNSAKTLISQNVDTSTPVITPPTSILNQFANANLSDVQYLSTERLIITTSTTAKDATLLINQHTDTPVIQNLPSETARTVQAQNVPSESSTINTNTTVNETTSFTRQHTDIDNLVMQNLSSDSTVIVTSAFSSPSTSIINQNIDLSSANLILTTSIPASQATTFTNQHTDTGIPVMQNLSSEGTVIVTNILDTPLTSLLNQSIDSKSSDAQYSPNESSFVATSTLETEVISLTNHDTETSIPVTQILRSESSIITNTPNTTIESLINQQTDTNLHSVQYLPSTNTTTAINTIAKEVTPTLKQNMDVNQLPAHHLPTEIVIFPTSSSVTLENTLLNQHTDANIPNHQNLPGITQSTYPNPGISLINQHIDTNTIQHLSNVSFTTNTVKYLLNEYADTELTVSSSNSDTPDTSTHLTSESRTIAITTLVTPATSVISQYNDAPPSDVQYLSTESLTKTTTSATETTSLINQHTTIGIPVIQKLSSETSRTTDETPTTSMLNQHSVITIPQTENFPSESSITRTSTTVTETTLFTNQHTDNVTRVTQNLSSESLVSASTTLDTPSTSLINQYTELSSERFTLTTNTPASETASFTNQHIDTDIPVTQNLPSKSLIIVTNTLDSPLTFVLTQNPPGVQYSPNQSSILTNQHADTSTSVTESLPSESSSITTSSHVNFKTSAVNPYDVPYSLTESSIFITNTPPTPVKNPHANTDIHPIQYLPKESLTTSVPTSREPSSLNQHIDTILPFVQYLPNESTMLTTNTTVEEVTSILNQYTNTYYLPTDKNISATSSSVFTTNTPANLTTSLLNEYADTDVHVTQLSSKSSVLANTPATFLLSQDSDINVPNTQQLSTERMTVTIQYSPIKNFIDSQKFASPTATYTTKFPKPTVQKTFHIILDGQTFDDINTITPVQETTRITHSDNLLISKNVSNLTEISTGLPSKNEIIVTAVPHHESVSPTPLARVSSAGEINAILVTEPISIVKTETTVSPLIINGDSTLGYSLESQQVTLHTTMKSSIDATKASVAPEKTDIIVEALLPLTTQITSINKQNSINNINLTDNKTAEIEYQNSNSKLYDLLQGVSVENYANNDPLIGVKSTVARFENVTSIHATLSDSSKEASLVNKLLTDHISDISKIEVINKDSDEQVGFSESSETSDESLENDATRLDSNEGEIAVIEEGMPSSSNELLSVKEDSVQSKQHHASHVLEGTNMEDYNNREILFPITERPYKINQELKSSTKIIIEPATAEHSPNFTIGTLAGYRTLPGIPHGKLYPGVAINMLSDISPFFDRVMVTEHINHDQPMLNLTNSDKSMLGLIIRTIDPIDRFEEETNTYDLEFDKSMTRAKLLPLFDSVMASARVTRLQIEKTSASTIISPKSVSIRVPITPPSILGTLLQTTSPNEVVSNLTLPCSTNESGTVSSSSEENIVKRDIKYSHVESKSPSNWTITNGLTIHNHTIIHKNRVPTPNVMSDPTWSSSINESTTESSFNEEVAFKEDVMYSQVTVSKSTLDYTSATSKSTAYQSANLHTTHHMNSTKITKTLHSLETNKVSLSEFECTAPGSFKHPSTNRDYYVCLYTDIGLGKYHFVCPSDQIYNSTSQQCTKYQENELDASDTFKCVKNGRFKNENDIQKYYWCLREGPTEFKKFILRCPNKSIFNSVMRTCIPVDVSDNETIPIADDSNESKEHNLNDNRQKSRLKILKDVKKNEKDVLKSEIKRLEKLRKLNEKLRRNDSEESKLEDREEKKLNVVINRFNIELKRILMTIDQLKVTMDEIEEGRSGGDSRKNELKFKCMTIGRFPDPNDCTKYFTCTVKSENFSKQRLQCKTGFRFDSLSKFCVNANYAVCG